MSEKLNLTSLFEGMSPVSLTEYRLINDRVARVILNTMPNANTNAVRASLVSELGGVAIPVPQSFRWLNEAKTSMLGFVALATAHRLLDDKDPVKAGYRLVANNMYISPEDESVWEMKTASAGTYLVRRGHDNLAELLEDHRVAPRGSTPRMASVITASAQPTELVAFVNSFGPATPVVDFGFAVQKAPGSVKVVTAMFDSPITVRDEEVVSSYTLDSSEVKRQFSLGASRLNVTAAPSGPSADYYKKLYSYAPEYLALVLKEISEMSAM